MLQLEGPWRHCVRWTKSERGGQILWGLNYMWNLKKKPANTQTHRERDQICDCRGMGWEMGEELDASDHKVQNSSFRITEIYTSKDIKYHMMITGNTAIRYIFKMLRVDPESFYHKGKNFLFGICMRWWMLTEHCGNDFHNISQVNIRCTP